MTDRTSTQPENTAADKKEAGFRLTTQEWIVVVLIGLSIIGVGITDFAPAASHWYWLAMVPLFGLACIFVEWDRANQKERCRKRHPNKRECIMKKFSLYFLILTVPVMLSLGVDLTFAAEEASSIMCDNGTVNIGDLQPAVQDTCGEPDSQNYELNAWVYNFGPSQPVYTLIFDKDGKLKKILEDEWGN